MAQARYKVTVTRTNQAAHQMAEQSMTLSGQMLLNLIRGFSEMVENGNLSSWMNEWGAGPFDPETFRSLTITRVDGEHEA